MAIIKNKKKPEEIKYNGHDVSRVYKGLNLIWIKIVDLIKSCFGNGYWINENPWLNDEGWKN